MKPANLPDLVGWELPRALDECQALGIRTTIVKTAPPIQRTVHIPAPNEHDEPFFRVIAVKPGSGGSVLLVVSAEKW